LTQWVDEGYATPDGVRWVVPWDAVYAILRSNQYGDVAQARVVNTKEIAEEYHIPVELLAKVLQTLSKSGIIESHNGPKGGYLLGKNPREITIAHVLESP